MFRYPEPTGPWPTMQPRQPTPVGTLLRKWRNARKMSQMALASEAEVSTRHISFVETGRAKPSREMILILASVMNVPLRERNAILTAAGFTPAYRTTDLSAPEMAPVRRALDFILKAQEPYGALVLDRRWDILMSNQGGTRMTSLLVPDPAPMLADGPPNLLRLLLHPLGLRRSISNWEEVARVTLQRAHRELAVENDDALREVMDQALAYPGVPKDFRSIDVVDVPPILYPIEFAVFGQNIRMFTTITTLGTAQDITLQELRVECFFPADEASELALRALASSTS